MRYALAILFLFALPALAAITPPPLEEQILEIERRVKVFDFEAGSALSIENLYNEALLVRSRISSLLMPEPVALVTPGRLEQYRDLAKSYNRHVVRVTRLTGRFPRLSLLPLRSWKIAHQLLMYKLRNENFAKNDTDANEALRNVSLANIPIAFRLIDKRRAEGKFTVGPDFAPELLASRQWREKRMNQRCEQILAATPAADEED